MTEGLRCGLVRVALAAFAFLAAPPLAEVAHARTKVLTLAEALAIALHDHPQLRAVRSGLKAQKERIEQARAGYFPSLSYNFSYTRRTANCVNQPGGFLCQSLPTTPSWYESFNFFQGSVSVNQPLYDFGRTGGAVDLARLGVHVSRAQIGVTRNDLALNVKLAYFTVLTQQELVRVAEESLSQQRKHLEQSRGFFESGTRTRIDVAQGESDVANAELQLLRARTNLETSKVALLGAIGAPSSDIDFDVRKEKLQPLTEEEDSAPGATVEGALSRRPDLRLVESQAEQQRRAISVAKSGYFPQLAVSVGPTFQGTDGIRPTTNFLATLSLSVPFGNGLNPYLTYHQVAEAHHNARTTRAQATQVRNDVKVEIESTRRTLSAAKRAVDPAERALVAAKERLELAEVRYQTGAGAIIELSDAQTALTQAQAARVQVGYDIEIARARFIKALGRM